MVKLIIMMAMVSFPVSHLLLTEATPLPQNSTHHLGPVPVHSHFHNLASCKDACHDIVCKHLHGVTKALCMVGCKLGCKLTPHKTPANPTFRRLHSCGVKTCAKFVG